MHNDRFAYITKVLEAIDNYYSEGGSATMLSGSALLLDDETTIAEAVSRAYDMMNNPNAPLPPYPSTDAWRVTPRSQRRSYGVNHYGEVWGWVGTKRAKQFKTIDEAAKWVSEEVQ